MNFYFSFYFIIPFINVIINNISKRQHIILICTTIALLSLPAFIRELGDFWKPLKETGISLPYYFSQDCFSFIYYFIGSYIRKYIDTVSIKCKYIIMACLCGSIFLHSSLDWCYLHIYQNSFEIGQHVYSFNAYGNIFTILSCSLFLVLLKGIKFESRWCNKVLVFISSHTLEMYLGLMIADKVLDKLCQKTGYMIGFSLKGFCFWFFGEIIVVSILAIGYSVCRTCVLKVFHKVIKRCK